MTVVVAGERSGVGKTTVTLALLAALSRWTTVQSFKVGPDYIDPMFHSRISGQPCRNLDPVLTSESYVQQCFAQHMAGVNYGLIEGVMGLFDGIRESDHFGSTAHIARLLNVPILLVIDCSRLSHSVAAIAHGYRTLDPRLTIAGVVLNRVGSDRHLHLLASALSAISIPILGVLRRNDAIAIPDRHLGLVPTDELAEFDRCVERLADLGQHCFDWDALLPLLKAESRSISNPPRSSSRQQTGQNRPLIAIARDRAFNFYYADNLDALNAFGADWVEWSPLRDAQLPEGTSGLYLGGGFPEVFAAELSANQGALTSVRSAIQQGMPTYAECGGLMYLCQQIIDFEHNNWPLANIVPATAHLSSKLTLGYRRAIALQDSSLIQKGTEVLGHEFHRSSLSQFLTQPIYELQSLTYPTPKITEGWLSNQLHASYLHLHWGATPELPQRFVQRCAEVAAGQD